MAFVNARSGKACHFRMGKMRKRMLWNRTIGIASACRTRIGHSVAYGQRPLRRRRLEVYQHLADRPLSASIGRNDAALSG
jgi:hypothetical protein